MTIKELIEELQLFDQDTEVRIDVKNVEVVAKGVDWNMQGTQTWVSITDYDS